VTNSLRWGILGTGGIATDFTKDLVANGFTVAAVGSRTQESADRFAAAHGILSAHGSYEALAADPGVDVIYVSTPHPFHYENARLALSGGKHVLVEKPFTLNAREAAEVIDEAKSRRLVVLEAMWTRWLPHMVRVHEIIEAGTLGEIRTVIADHNQRVPVDVNGRMYNPDLGGGALLDLGVYPVSFAWDMLGEPSSVSAISAPTITGVDRQTAIVLGYPGGQQALLHAALDTRGPNRAAVIGTEGRIEIDSVWYSPTTFTVYDSAGEVVERFDRSVENRGMQYEAWALEAIVAAGTLEGAELPSSETIGIMRTLDAVREAIGLTYPDEH
jgi:predicted dehydrogenase